MASSNFIDYVKINFRSGAGGAGASHLRHEKNMPMGGPDGGDGGRGGHIVLRGNSNVWTLLHLKYRKHIKAEGGKKGSSNKSSGAQGQDEIIDVPLGTIARHGETGEQMAEIIEDGQEIILLNGGRGGLGNIHFASSTKQTPLYAQPGDPEKEEWIVLELKLLADVGLVGFPNAGKSTLLSVVSAAKPEIADYAFTTLVPNLGVVSYRDYQSFVMADIPGIIEGASEGKGLGLRFLRHIDRNSVLLFLIPAISENVSKDYKILLNELELYNPALLEKKRVLAVSMCDLIDKKGRKKLEKQLPKDLPCVFISAVVQEGMTELKDLLWQTLNEE